jgi:hypothetical protein
MRNFVGAIIYYRFISDFTQLDRNLCLLPCVSETVFCVTFLQWLLHCAEHFKMTESFRFLIYCVLMISSQSSVLAGCSRTYERQIRQNQPGKYK